MKAGRALDAMAAEKIMGLSVCHCHDKYPFAAITVSIATGGIEYGVPACLRCDKSPAQPYSEEIKAAWELVHYLWMAGHDIEITSGSCWYVKYTNADGEFVHIESSDSLPHAICLAALKAAGAR